MPFSCRYYVDTTYPFNLKSYYEIFINQILYINFAKHYMKLKLVGFLSGFDKFGRLVFVKEPTSEGKKSMDKIWTIQKRIDGRSPITPRGFSVVLAKNLKLSTSQMADINACLGCHCEIKASVREYNFVNKEGVEMIGFTLELSNSYNLKKAGSV